MDTTNFNMQRYTAPEYTPRHCCALMDMALDGGWIEPTITFGAKVYPPRIIGPKLTRTGRKKRPDLLLRHCPWCGKKLTEDEDRED